MAAPSPTGLLCDLLRWPERTRVANPRPRFGWVVEAGGNDAVQSAYQILVATGPEALAAGRGDVWDSGKVVSRQSVAVAYGGPPLQPNARYAWKVRTWGGTDTASDWSAPQRFATAAETNPGESVFYPVEVRRVAPAVFKPLPAGGSFVDFGKAAFGWLELEIDSPDDGATVRVHLGEKLDGGRIDRKPGGSVRYATADVALRKGRRVYKVQTPPDARNTHGAAVRVPAELGVLLPFRYAEVEPGPARLDAASVRQAAVAYPFDDTASAFASSDPALDAVWGLCKYSIKATSAFGLYVDGDRERIPYEADAYINQLGHYCCDREFTLARRTHEYLLAHPTWPTEWKHHSVLMAWADWMYTGDADCADRHFDLLKSEKTLESLARADGLLDTSSLKGKDLVDWPAAERDGYVFGPVNTVVNAFYCRALACMADLAAATGRADESRRYARMRDRATAAFNAALFDPAAGLYADAEGAAHSSQHANFFPLAFGLVPPARARRVVDFVKSRGTACSVYGAQYLLEALYESDEADHALKLMTTGGVRGWLNMIRLGSTVTLEAWDPKFKPNLDWNHAWGAAPANVVPRLLLGVRPLEPGFAKLLIHPRPGTLAYACGTTPTIRGPVRVTLEQTPGKSLKLAVELPANTTARVVLPRMGEGPQDVSLDGRRAAAVEEARRFVVDPVGPGLHTLEIHAS